MKTELQTRCTLKMWATKPNLECGGAIMRDHRLSNMEVSMGHRKYTCLSCSTSWKFTGTSE